MQSLQPLLTGTVIADRYVVESLLGTGGFSAVYLVKDQQNNDKLFAMKELIDHKATEKARFAYEGRLLTRLEHRALPRVYDVFEDTDGTSYILMDYIEGSNLEMLRKSQPEKRFTLSQVLSMMEPIIDALRYLHEQQSPVIHRDIKPSNIIIPQAATNAVLVDFGIAKEYDPEDTTTAVRHCSPGYGAPEQYSSTGTDPRTDIYGLAATLYALLTGTVPVDALNRATSIASKDIDPLQAVQELAPHIPPAVAAAIHRALAINPGKRFASVQEFWQALHVHASPDTDRLTPSLRIRTLRPTFLPASVSGKVVLTALALFLLIVGSLGFWSYDMHKGHTAIMTSPAHLVMHTPTATHEALPGASYSKIARTYQGTLHDLLTSTSSSMTLTAVQQRDATIQGNFTGLHKNGSFTGVLDTSRHIFFTVTTQTDQAKLFFEGSIHADGNLAGNYCTLDGAGQCVGNYGLWSITPQK